MRHEHERSQSHPGVDVGEASDGAQWDAFVASRPGASVHHAWVWRDLIAQAYNQRPHYLLARRGGRLTGLLPLIAVRSRFFGTTLVSLPYHWTGGVLSLDGETTRALIDAALTLRAELSAKAIVIRDRARHEEDGFQAHGGKATFSLSLPAQPEELFRGLRKQNRTRIRKGEREGLTIRFGHDLLDAFYDLYCRTMTTLGTPVCDRRVFARVLSAFGSEANCAVAFDRERPAAAKLFVDAFGTRAFIWGANDRRYQAAAPNYSLMWACLENAIARGLVRADLGRSNAASTQAETKREWGGTEEELYYSVAMAENEGATRAQDSGAMRLASGLWRRLPVAISKRLGPPIARHLP